MNANGTGARNAEHVEQLIDKMSKDSFPASDAPQLEGLGEGPVRDRLPSAPAVHAPPPQVAVNTTAERSPFDRDGRYPLGGQAEVALQTQGDHVRVELAENPTTLDVAGLEALIAALERHRPSLHRP